MKITKAAVQTFAFLAVSLSTRALCSSAAPHYKNVKDFLAKHAHVVVSAYADSDSTGAGSVQFVYDDIRAGVAIIVGTQDPDFKSEDIIGGKSDEYEGGTEQVVTHRQGVPYKYTDPGNKVERIEVEPELRVAYLRQKIAQVQAKTYAAEDVHYKNIRDFISKHPHLVAKSYGIAPPGGSGWEAVIYDDVPAGVAVQFDTTDPETASEEIIAGRSEDAEYIKHTPDIAYKFKFPDGRVIWGKVDPPLELKYLRQKIAQAEIDRTKPDAMQQQTTIR